MAEGLRGSPQIPACPPDPASLAAEACPAATAEAAGTEVSSASPSCHLRWLQAHTAPGSWGQPGALRLSAGPALPSQQQVHVNVQGRQGPRHPSRDRAACELRCSGASRLPLLLPEPAACAAAGTSVIPPAPPALQGRAGEAGAAAAWTSSLRRCSAGSDTREPCVSQAGSLCAHAGAASRALPPQLWMVWAPAVAAAPVPPTVRPQEREGPGQMPEGMLGLAASSHGVFTWRA